MPLTTLLCEGQSKSLDPVVLGALCAGSPLLIHPVGGKLSLGAHHAGFIHGRRVSDDACKALRDRDFDYEPRVDEPELVEWKWSDRVIGWRWKRHELESYLVDPALAKVALEKHHAALTAIYDEVFLRAVERVRPWAAARWTVGAVAREHRRIDTRPDPDAAKLPDESKSVASCRAWLHAHVDAHAERIPGDAERDRRFDDRLAVISRTLDVNGALLWFPGKDLLAAVAEAGAALGATTKTSGDLLKDLQEWVRDNPDRARELVPAFRAIVDQDHASAQ